MKRSPAIRNHSRRSRSSLLRVSGAIALALALAACSPQASEEELLTRARQALDEGDMKAAIIDVKTALQGAPDNATGRRMLGEIYMFQQNPAAASDEFDRALAAGEDPEVRVLYGRALVSAGRYQELLDLHARGEFDNVQEDPRYLATRALALVRAAEEEDLSAAQEMLDRAVLAAPEDPYVATTHGFFLVRYLGALGEASASLQAAVARHPDYAEAWSLLGDIQQMRGEHNLAETSYRNAARINPYRLQDRLNLVSMRIEQDNFEGAKTELDPLVASYPNHPDVKFAQGRMLFETGDYKGALVHFSAVLGAMPRHSGSLYLAALANVREGHRETAVGQLNAFLAEQPQHVHARLQLASLYLQVGQPKSAEELARDVLAEQEGNDQALALLSAALSGRGLHAESAEVSRQLVEAQPDNVDTRLALGHELLLAGDSAAAIGEFEAARELDRDREATWERLLQARLTAGDIATATTEARAFADRFPNSPRPSLFLGRLALQQNDLTAARGHFKQALALEPGNVVANSGLAVLAAGESDLDQARQHYLDALTHHPEDTASLMNLAAIEQQRGDVGAMESALQSAVQSDAAALAPRLSLARLRLEEGNHDEALRLLRALRKDYPGEPAIWLLLGEALLLNDELPAAAAAAKQLRVLLPEDPVPLTLAARVAYRSGAFAEAEGYVTRALELQPNNADLRKLMADILVSQGKLEAAGAMLESLPENLASEPAVLVAKGRIALARNLPAQAEPLLRSALAADPRSTTLLWLSGALSGQGRQDDSIALLEDWLAEHPGDTLVRTRLATYSLQLGRDTDARQHYLQVIKEAPDDVVVLNNLGWLFRQEDPERALGYIEAAHRLAPDDPRVKDTYAMVRLERGEVRQALALNEKALDAMPDDPQLLYHRAMILQADGRREEAVKILEDILSKPGFAQAQEARGFLAQLQDS